MEPTQTSTHIEHEHSDAYDMIVAQQQMTAKDLKEHLTGPLIAIIAHLIVIPIMLTVVIIEQPEQNDANTIKPFVEEVVTPPEPPPEPEPPEPTEVEVTDVEFDTPSMDPSPAEDVQVGDVSISEQAPEPLPPVTVTRPNDSAKVLSSLYAARFGGKGSAVGRGGGGKAGQLSVLKGLKWLADHQNPDGSWGNPGGPYGNISPALTALASMAFLAQGITQEHPRFGKNVAGALTKMVEWSGNLDGKGCIRDDKNGYGHGIVTYALSDAAAMTQIPDVVDAMNKCAGALVSGMNGAGAYAYNYDKSGNNDKRVDISISGWCYQALKAAHASGATAEGLSATIDKAVKSIKKQQKKNGSFQYQEGNLSWSPRAANMTPVGALCLQLLDNPQSPEVKSAIDFLVNPKNGSLMEMNWKDAAGYRKSAAGPNSFEWRIYAWYYQTQVFFQNANGQKDERYWKLWRISFEKALVTEQNEDGSWDTPATKYADGNKISGFAENNGSLGNELNLRIYSTAMCCLMLEVYYRFLPSFQVKELEKAEGETSLDGGEGLVDI